MGIVYHNDYEQGSIEWLKARCGILTASQMHKILTTTGDYAQNEKSRAFMFEMIAQRITGHVEPQYVSDDMLRGQEDEIRAIAIYDERYSPVSHVGFVTNDAAGFLIGCSPDALVGDDGMVEVKSRRNHLQIKTMICDATFNRVPSEYIAQIQTALWVTGRKWCDFISYSGGLPMIVTRVEACQADEDNILIAANRFEHDVERNVQIYLDTIDRFNFVETERTERMEMII